jgi:hypothetical protein
MISSNPDATKLSSVRKQLARFSCLASPPTLSETERTELREALLWFNDLADYQTLGVCADQLRTAKQATEAYIAALGNEVTLDLPPREGTVYLKFNTLNGAWYLDDYSGPSRGVLVSYHASDPALEVVNGTYGPFPFDLFGGAE